VSARGGEEVLIVGAGLVGSLTAIALARRGLGVEVRERRPDPREGEGAGGRSINLVVASRGIRPLGPLGLERAVLQLTVPVHGRMMHSVTGELAYQPYGRDDSECNYSVSRGELNALLISEAERRGVRFEFGRGLVGADLGAGRFEFADERGKRRTLVDAPSLVFGADGAASAVRAAMAGQPGFEESVDLLEFGYKELTVPAGPGGSFPIDKHALHIWPRGHLMLMALPNRDGSFTATLYLPHRGPSSFEHLDTVARVVELFETQFPDAVRLLPDLATEFFAHPTGRLGTVRCRPWYAGEHVGLIGDAAHAIVPFFGQGMNAGFEDCRVLGELLDAHGTSDPGRVLKAYFDSRKPDADAIADMALENFVEMRDRVGDARFLLRKEVEHRLEERLPREYRSRYSMVMYGSFIPYRVALEAGQVQQSILDRLCDGLSSPDEMDFDLARRLIAERLTPFFERHGVSLDY
jgi:kynurenine 3-monooxygenase